MKANKRIQHRPFLRLAPRPSLVGPAETQCVRRPSARVCSGKQQDDCLYSPHIAGIDTGSLDAMATMAAETVVAVLRGETPPAERVANPDVLPLRERS